MPMDTAPWNPDTKRVIALKFHYRVPTHRHQFAAVMAKPISTPVSCLRHAFLGRMQGLAEKKAYPLIFFNGLVDLLQGFPKERERTAKGGRP